MESLCLEPLSCCYVRIGSYKVFPPNEKKVSVYMTPDSIKFFAPNIREYLQLHEIVIKCEKNKMIWCLEEKAVLFIYPEPAFAEEVRNLLGIDRTCLYTFDPLHKDMRSMFITFIISFLTPEQINFIRNHYLPIETCIEITEQGYQQLMAMTAPVLSANVTRLCLSHFDEGTELGVSAVKEVTVASYRSKSRAGVLPITNVDILCLGDGNQLNDNIVNFYLEFIYSEYLTESEREKTHLFNTFFFSSLNRKIKHDICDSITSMKLKRHDLVKSWTRKVDLFSKDYIVIPVNLCKHWFLVIVCFPCNMTDFSNTPNVAQRQGMPCIYIFDSIYNRRRAAMTAAIVRDYLETEYTRKKEVHISFLPMKIFAMRCPQQPNSYDCGIYLLKNFECFFKRPFESKGVSSSCSAYSYNSPVRTLQPCLLPQNQCFFNHNMKSKRRSEYGTEAVSEDHRQLIKDCADYVVYSM
ncbi:hypothetical protein TNIN_205991 [Trichonephila inaurata madagascariensis]|uniref:Ubiquitin-like protease family profile domain-containing protein n=1 Tax=Trichonephila inaurata madagascariensis TaxID=2747483 RepID=A0A8X6X4N0_9ARAC|nr:hypothetical protein TNIN_205991 [Trichonephila inaurata madagascariensis]